MQVSLKQLRYFAALADAGSFGRAAARVSVTQPALSLQIKELESTLGARLIERTRRDAKLTRAGQQVLARARRILAEVGDLEQAARLSGGLSGRLHLGVIPTVAPYLLPAVLTDIRSQAPALDLRVREAMTAPLVELLLRGQLDAAIVALPVADAGVIAEPLFEDRFLLAGAAHDLARWHGAANGARPTQITPDELLLLDEGHCLADQALEVCGMAQRQPMDLGASSLATLCGLAAQGFGMTLVPEIAAQAETRAAPGLKLLRFDAPEPARQVGLIRRASSADEGWAHSLTDILRAAGQRLIDRARAAGDPAHGGP
ncbi:MAG: LysR substrate-binding domain-containing protein [Pseudomonadota bacterium]